MEGWRHSCQPASAHGDGQFPCLPIGRHVITETVSYFWARDFCKRPIEVVHASRRKRGWRGQRFPLPLPLSPWRIQKSAAFPVITPGRAQNEEGQELWAAQVTALTSEESLDPERVEAQSPN